MSRKILLVDDAVMFLEIQKGFLKLSTLPVICARDGLEALETARRERPGLIVMDLHMPNMNGAECCRHIKGDPDLASIPVVMTTGAGKAADHELCRSAGCDDLMTKPFDRAMFLDMVRRFLPEVDRREPRLRLSAAIRFNAFRVAMAGMVVDVSFGGVFIATEFELDVGNELLMTFSLMEDGSNQIQAKGTVRWKNSGNSMPKTDYPPGFGVEFMEFAGSSEMILKRFLLKHGF